MAARISRDQACIETALTWARRSSCDRAHVGAVIITHDGRPLSWGYNNPYKGQPHCDEVGHMIVNGSCIRTVHAEQNAIAFVARTGGSALQGATMYVTHYPCFNCAKLISAVEIARLVFLNPYGNPDDLYAYKFLENVQVEQYTGDYRS